jgi:hypothetical protein
MLSTRSAVGSFGVFAPVRAREGKLSVVAYILYGYEATT